MVVTAIKWRLCTEVVLNDKNQLSKSSLKLITLCIILHWETIVEF